MTDSDSFSLHSPDIPQASRKKSLHSRLTRICTIWPDLWPEWRSYHFRPVKRGIIKDIRVWLAEHPEAEINFTDVSKVFNFVTSRLAYQEQLTEGTTRSGLDGQPAGTVTSSEAEFAARQIPIIRKKIADGARRREQTST
ncbi:ProQ/FINO family protein [Kosakonia sp. S42]|uniref:ProQ/FINO family protein n=1 Tax=Kosakonia sp. S42 TaxID=2767458 RepID=UPI00190C20BA|nr:ProQ/FINO family protein [Kosakonia sp. S42]MBK0018996.1 hypothetical protein [Kosakonia sp. S42]